MHSKARFGAIRALIAVIAVPFFLGSAGSAAANSYALVIGADQYERLPALRGAVNDAKLLAQTLRDTGVEVHTLFDKQATRAAIFDEFRSLIAQAKAGDWIIFTYAGHGGREPLQSSNAEVVSTFLLPGYDNPKPSNGERIINHEFRALLETVPKSVTVLFLADSCHSASMVRSLSRGVDGAGYSYRGTNYGPITEDALPPPPQDTDAKGPAGLANVIFVGASLDEQNTPEVTFHGEYHGAVSWFFSKALRGEADSNGDGKTTLAELQRYIEIDAREAASSQQTPQVVFGATRANDAFPLARNQPAPVSTSGEEGTSVFVLGGAAAEFGGLRKIATIAASRTAADFLWDPNAGTVINNRAGDLVAERVTSLTALSGVIDKWKALPELRPLLIASPIDIRVGPGPTGARYVEGDHVSISIPASGDASLQYLTVVDLASTGVVQLLFPSPGKDTDAGAQDPHEARGWEDNVVAPFGADHVIAIRTAEEPVRLRAALREFACRPSASDFVTLLRQTVSDGRYALGMAPLYTAPRMAQELAPQPAPSVC